MVGIGNYHVQWNKLDSDISHVFARLQDLNLNIYDIKVEWALFGESKGTMNEV